MCDTGRNSGKVLPWPFRCSIRRVTALCSVAYRLSGPILFCTTASRKRKREQHYMHASTVQSTAHRFRLGCRWSSTAAPKRATAALPCQSKSNSKAARAHSTSSQPNKSSVRQGIVQANDRQTASGFQAGPAEEAPSYTAIDAALMNKGIMALFRQKMVDAIGQDSQETGYESVWHTAPDMVYYSPLNYIYSPWGQQGLTDCQCHQEMSL